ncbi:MAG: hypothetical protein K2Q20_01350, partial [Phycisphaerales bacterium]|nr:hypothetical protein [Phycisphaerales bacterium]
ETYNTVAETIAGPSLRIGDNLIQAAIIVGCTGLGAIVGFFGWGGIGAAVGGVGMMVVSTLVSGGVLMVLGWVRAARKRR